MISGAESWLGAIEMLIDDPRESPEMIVAACASESGTISQPILDGLQNLRDLGVAEPD